eukprot:gene2066-2352_t
MFAIKLTLILLGALLYLVGTVGWFFWLGPLLLDDGETADILYAFAGTCGWMLITFSLVIHIIKTARPTAAGGRFARLPARKRKQARCKFSKETAFATPSNAAGGLASSHLHSLARLPA